MICTTQRYSGIWAECFRREWISPEYWYSRAGSQSYGPRPEQEIRQRLAESAKDLSPSWGPHCGVHERLPERRDTGDRAQLRAEIDAYVAHLYGLSRDDFVHILDTFPVLRRKEEASFGEFRSRRKCLEEYDRIEQMLTS